jgi:hypothetical protein
MGTASKIISLASFIDAKSFSSPNKNGGKIRRSRLNPATPLIQVRGIMQRREKERGKKPGPRLRR